MTTLHLTLKMTTAHVVEMSVTKTVFLKDYPHPDHNAKQIKQHIDCTSFCMEHTYP